MEPKVRFIDNCNKCGARIREFRRIEIIDGEEEEYWIPENHETPDCIRYLDERIARLEQK